MAGDEPNGQLSVLICLRDVFWDIKSNIIMVNIHDSIFISSKYPLVIDGGHYWPLNITMDYILRSSAFAMYEYLVVRLQETTHG